MGEYATQPPELVRRHKIRVPLYVLGLVAVLAVLAWLDSSRFRVTDEERLPDDTEELHDQAVRVNDPDVFRTKATLTLPDSSFMEFRYCPLADSGVDMQKV